MGVKLFVGEFWHNPDKDWQQQLNLQISLYDLNSITNFKQRGTP